MRMERMLSWVIGLLLCGFIFIAFAEPLLNSATGKLYTEEDWFMTERYFCAAQSLTAVEYIVLECSLFGCVDVQKTKCVGANGTHTVEKMIDYDDHVFCKYTLKNDIGLC